MNIKDKSVIIAEDYDKVDGREAYQSQNKSLTLDYDGEQIVAKIWKEIEGEGERAATEIPLHQLLDLAIFVCKGLEYFKEAYRHPKLYDRNQPIIERVGLQGSAMTVKVCTENEDIDKQIQLLSQALNDADELIGERIRNLAGVLEELEG